MFNQNHIKADKNDIISLFFKNKVTKDKEDLKFAVKHDLDYIALSFVNSAQNIIEVKKELAKLNASEKLQLFAKIESTDAIKNFNEILQEADGIMVARGDLGLEVPFYDIPY